MLRIRPLQNTLLREHMMQVSRHGHDNARKEVGGCRNAPASENSIDLVVVVSWNIIFLRRRRIRAGLLVKLTFSQTLNIKTQYSIFILITLSLHNSWIGMPYDSTKNTNLWIFRERRQEKKTTNTYWCSYVQSKLSGNGGWKVIMLIFRWLSIFMADLFPCILWQPCSMVSSRLVRDFLMCNVWFYRARIMRYPWRADVMKCVRSTNHGHEWRRKGSHWQ